MPTPSTSVETTGLAWGVRSSFRRYVQRIAMGSELLDGGAGSLSDGRLYFPLREVTTLDRESLDAELSFDGAVRFLGHAGMIDLRLGEWELHLTGGRGVLRTSSQGGARDLVGVQVTTASADETAMVLNLSSRLEAGAEYLFDDVYAAWTVFDDLEIRLPVAP